VRWAAAPFRTPTAGLYLLRSQKGQKERTQVSPYRQNSGSNMKVLDKLELADISTKTFFGIVRTLSLTKPLFIIDKKDETVEKSARNIPYVKVLRVEGLNVYDIIRHEQLIMTVDALKKVEEVLAS